MEAVDFKGAKLRELAAKLEFKCIIYLDTNFWVHLRNAQIGGSSARPIFREILALLLALKGDGRICCPLGFGSVEELMRQSDLETRLATAQLMDDLSDGVCIRDLLSLLRVQFEAHVIRIANRVDAETDPLCAWTKIGFWAGNSYAVPKEWKELEREIRETRSFMLFWQMSVEQFQGMPGWVQTPDTFFESYLKSAIRAKFELIGSGFGFKEIMAQKRSDLISFIRPIVFSEDFLQQVCASMPGTAYDHITAILDPIYEGTDPLAVPSANIIAGLETVLSLDSNRRENKNDLLDALHAAQALPHCDAFFCEKYLCHKIKAGPLELDKVYGKVVGCKPEELKTYLQSVS